LRTAQLDEPVWVLHVRAVREDIRSLTCSPALAPHDLRDGREARVAHDRPGTDAGCRLSSWPGRGPPNFSRQSAGTRHPGAR
jgi:hypothetical protein